MQIFSRSSFVPLNRVFVRWARRFTLIAFLLPEVLFFPGFDGRPVQAQSPSGAAGARAFVEGVGREAVERLPARKLGRAEARAAFQKILRAHFDVAGIGGRVFADQWPEASAAQRKEALALYEAWVTDGLMNLMGRHTGESFRLLPAAATVQQSSGRYSVGSEIRRPGGERVRVDWSVRPTGGGWLITNLRTPDGGDLVATHRDEFRLMLEQAPAGAESSGLEYIIEELRIRTAPLNQD
jgi:ABC-type transporter MlaC component